LISGLFLFSSLASAKPSLCSSEPVFLLPEAAVINMLNLDLMSDGPVSLPQRVQCGLTGENWRVCLDCTSRISAAAFSKARPMLASRSHREWHYWWHAIRVALGADGVYTTFPSQDTISQWQKQGWLPTGDVSQFVTDHKLGGHLAGEDFLYMHRQMIKMVQVELAHQGEKCMTPWYDLPLSALDNEWPLPRALALQTRGQSTVDEQQLLDTARSLSDKVRNDRYMRSVSLNQLGNEIENSFHAQLHLLYASPHSKCLNPNTDDSVDCDDLTHNRSSHVNIHFWKLHGFIDELIGHWLRANGKTNVAVDCRASSDPAGCYQWKGTWLGVLPEDL
jgi:hypothetical protein